MTATLTYQKPLVAHRVPPEQSFRFRTGTRPPTETLRLRRPAPRLDPTPGFNHPHQTKENLFAFLSSDSPCAAGETTRAVLPNPRRWAAQIARCSLEAIEGVRPISQLNRWLSPLEYRRLEQRKDSVARGQLPNALRTSRTDSRFGPISILSAHCHQTINGAQEAIVILHDGKRGRASAIRLEAQNDRWVATSVKIG